MCRINVRDSYCTFSMDCMVLRLLSESSNGCKVLHLLELYEGKNKEVYWKMYQGIL